jgi:CrcB protein
VTLRLALAVAVGGLVGAPARYLVDRVATDRFDAAVPLGTLLVNVSGAALFGLLSGLRLSRHLGPVPLALFGTGFCGAYTTFSTLTVEIVQLLEDGELFAAAVTVSVSLVAGLLAAGAGVAIGLAL